MSYGGGDGDGLEPPEKWADGGSCHSSPGWFWLLQEMNFGGFDAQSSPRGMESDESRRRWRSRRTEDWRRRPKQAKNTLAD